MAEFKEIERTAKIGVSALILSLSIIKAKQKQNKTKRRWWERPHLGVHKRTMYGQQNLLEEMRISDVDSFVSIVRLRPQSFDKLLLIVGPSIAKSSNRESINPSTRLAVTLRYLATGEDVKSLSYNYRLGISTTHGVIRECIGTLYNTLKPLVLPEMNPEAWEKLAEGFLRRWNVPNCCGAVDGKHIRIKKPEKSGSEYHNYKSFFSTVMMAICDSEYKFVAADTGCQGRNNDVVVLNGSDIGIKLMNGTLGLPREKKIKHGPTLPHFLLGDEIFGLKPYLMVPYPGRGTDKLTYLEKIYNYRQARGRRVIEIAYGIYANVWGIFSTTIKADPVIVDRIVLACVCLHNFRIMENESITEFLPTNAAVRNTHLESISGKITRSHADKAEFVRSELAEYFVSGGSVPWQDGLIH